MILSPYRKRRRRRIHRHLAWQAELANRPKRSVMELLFERMEEVRRDMDEISGVTALMCAPPYEWKPYSLGFRVEKEAKK